jgi:hypothetical protein
MRRVHFYPGDVQSRLEPPPFPPGATAARLGYRKVGPGHATKRRGDVPADKLAALRLAEELRRWKRRAAASQFSKGRSEQIGRFTVYY